MPIVAFKKRLPTINHSVYIADSAYVIGEVTLGEDCSLWPGAIVRGDVNTITIGKRVNIQDHAVIHVTHQGPYNPQGFPTVIGDDVTIGHRATLHGCTIGDLCLIGIGAIILDGVHIEPHTMIAAGALVPPGKHLPSGSLWLGNPARAVRPLTEKELAFFDYSAKHYVKLKNQYLEINTNFTNY